MDYHEVAKRLMMFQPKPFTQQCSSTFKDLLKDVQEERNTHQLRAAGINSILYDKDNSKQWGDLLTRSDDDDDDADDEGYADDDDSKILQDVHMANHPTCANQRNSETSSTGTYKESAPNRSAYRYRPRTTRGRSGDSKKRINIGVATRELLDEQPIILSKDNNARSQLYDRYLHSEREWFQGIRSVLTYADVLEDVRRKLRMRNKLTSNTFPRQINGSADNLSVKILERRSQTSMGHAAVKATHKFSSHQELYSHHVNTRPQTSVLANRNASLKATPSPNTDSRQGPRSKSKKEKQPDNYVARQRAVSASPAYRRN